jgi:hypothetical protein
MIFIILKKWNYRLHLSAIFNVTNVDLIYLISLFCEFVGGQIIENFEYQMSNNGDVIIAFHIVTTMLNDATVQDDKESITNPIELSKHSYVDI